MNFHYSKRKITMRYIKYIIFSAVLLLAFQAEAQVNAVLSVENEKVVNGNYEFSIMIRTADNNTGGALYLGNADFVFNYNSDLFTNPTFEKIGNSTDLLNSQGQDATVNLLIDLSLSTQLNAAANNSVLGDMIIVNLNGIYPADNNALMSSVPRVDATSCVYKVGEFRITGLNDPSTVDAGLTWVSNGPITTDVYSYNMMTFDGEQANLQYEDGECGIGLPIELLTFDGWNEGAFNQLVWKTATEENSDYFEVQRSINGTDFMRIGEVQAAGNSLQVRSYDFQDNQPIIGLGYYRLKMVDLDGSFEYSNVVAIPIKLRDNTAVFPVPAFDALNVVYDAAVTGEITVNMVDALGKTLMTNVENTAQGFNQFQYDISQLPAGAYFLNVVDGSEAPIVRPFIKK